MLSIKESTKRFFEDLKEGFKLADRIKYIKGKKAIIGMGGSGIAGKIISSIDPNVISINDYKENVKSFLKDINKLILVSYSGNTEEVLSYLRDRRIAAILSSNGVLLKYAKRHNIPIHILPKGYQPRAALPFILPVLAKLTSKKAFNVLKRHYKNSKKSRKRIRINPKNITIIYGYETYKPIAYRWKTQLNENAKIPAFYNELPEANHNEIEAIKGLNILCVGKPKNERIMKRIEFLKKEFRAIHINQENIIDLIYMGDVLSVKLANKLKRSSDKLTFIPKLKKFMGDLK